MPNRIKNQKIQKSGVWALKERSSFSQLTFSRTAAFPPCLWGIFLPFSETRVGWVTPDHHTYPELQHVVTVRLTNA